MEEIKQKNEDRIEALAKELGRLYQSKQNNQTRVNDYSHKLDKIHAEISIRTVLQKIYINKELNESNLVTLNKFILGIELYNESEFLKGSDKDKFIFESEVLISNIDNYDEDEKEILREAYSDYNIKINQILENKEQEKPSILNRIRIRKNK